MVFGRIVSPVDPQHSQTAAYIAADWDAVRQSGASIDMYVPTEEGDPRFAEASSESRSLGQRLLPDASADLLDRAARSRARNWEALRELADH